MSKAPRAVEDGERPHLFYDVQPKALKALVMEAMMLRQANPDLDVGVLAWRFSQAAKIEPRIAREMLGTLYFRSLVNYVTNGQQSFAVGPRLQEMFKQTSIPSKVEAWMLRVPYPTFYVALPGCVDRIWGTYNTLSHVRGVMVDTQYKPGHMAMMICAPVRAEVVMAHHRLDEYGASQVELTEARRLELSGNGNDSYIIFNIEEAVADAEGLEAHILRKWSQATLEEGWPQVAVQVTAEARVNILKIVLGSILYLQSDQKDLSPDKRAAQQQVEREELQIKICRTKNPAKRKKAEERLKSLPGGAVITWLGRQIEEGAELDGLSPEQVDAEGRRVLRRHWVRGHWRRPARKHGPRVMRWIQPFLRGSGEAVVSRLYEIEEPG